MRQNKFSNVVPTFNNCLGLGLPSSGLGSINSSTGDQTGLKRVKPEEESDENKDESLCSEDSKRRRDVKKQRKENTLVPGYRQVNYMQMLNEIISNDFIDDRLTKFLNILSGGADAEILQLSDHSAGSTPLESPLQLHLK